MMQRNTNTAKDSAAALRTGGPRPKPAPRAPVRPLVKATQLLSPGYPDNCRRITRLTYRVTVAANALSSI